MAVPNICGSTKNFEVTPWFLRNLWQAAVWMDYTDNDLIKSNIVLDADNEHCLIPCIRISWLWFYIKLNSIGVQDTEVAWFQASAVV
jgi:hypothetical protein